MSVCNRCDIEIGGADSIKCEGICGKIYHITCAGATKGISKSFLNSYLENDYFIFLCSSCRCSNVKSISDSVTKILNMLVIHDERLERQGIDIVKLNDNYEEIKDALEKNASEKEIHDGLQEIKNSMKNDSKLFGSEMEDIKEAGRNNTGQMMKGFEEVKDDIKNNENEIRSELKKGGDPDQKIKTTFADKLKMMVNEPMVILKPKNVQDNKKTKNDLKMMIDPSSVQVHHGRDLAKGGLALACSSSTASKQLQEMALEKMGADYEVKLTELKTPKIKIIGMSDELSAEEIVTKIKAQN